MRVQTGRFTRWKPDSPAAAWYFFIFFTKNSLCEFFVKKIWGLPPCRRLNYLPGQGPHNSSNLYTGGTVTNCPACRFSADAQKRVPTASRHGPDAQKCILFTPQMTPSDALLRVPTASRHGPDAQKCILFTPQMTPSDALLRVPTASCHHPDGAEARPYNTPHLLTGLRAGGVSSPGRHRPGWRWGQHAGAAQ